jgi:predicted ATPase
LRIDKLKIKRFKNLREFSINFDEETPTTVLVGRNGTGKSNLLEALTIIFRDLDLAADPSFPYELDYICRGKKVHIEANPEVSKSPHIAIDGEGISFRQFSDRSDRQYLPNYVFGYYSGPSNRMEEHFLRHQQRFYRDLLDGIEKPLRPLFYARPVHSQFVLLAFFIDRHQDVLNFLKERLWIDGLDSVLFVMREPEWSRGGISSEGDPRFWNARGTVRTLLDKLYGLSLAPLRLSRRVAVSFRRSTTRQFLYLYLKDLDTIGSLAKEYPSQQELFKALESTYISELISEVRIKVKVRNVDGSLTFRELSEGEQQLLMVLGLLRFTREDESLFLLDEPDTHLNPAWSVQYLEFLRNIAGAQENSHIIMATHDPLVVAGLTKSQVQILRRNEETGQISAELPEQDPKGMGVAALLTSEIYGLRSQLDLETMQLLDRKRELAVKEPLSPGEREELRELDHQLAGLDFTIAVRDPLYKRFVNAMTARQQEKGLTAPVLTKEQQEQQKDLAMEILKELEAEERQS